MLSCEICLLHGSIISHLSRTLPALPALLSLPSLLAALPLATVFFDLRQSASGPLLGDASGYWSLENDR